MPKQTKIDWTQLETDIVKVIEAPAEGMDDAKLVRIAALLDRATGRGHFGLCLRPETFGQPDAVPCQCFNCRVSTVMVWLGK